MQARQSVRRHSRGKSSKTFSLGLKSQASRCAGGRSSELTARLLVCRRVQILISRLVKKLPIEISGTKKPSRNLDVT